MPRIHLLATSLLASACALQAAAQTPAPSLTPNTLTSPQTLPSNGLPSTFTITVPPGASTLHFTAPQDNNIPALHSDIKVLGSQVQRQSALAQLAKEQARLTSPQTTQPCAKLKVYGFTPKDLKSPTPHASTETDCTPLATAHVTLIQVPTTLK